MANHLGNNRHSWGSTPMPCITCRHQSRDHGRNTKQADGSWNGKCQFENCDCQLYIRPKTLSIT